MNVESTKNVDRSSGAAPGGPRIPRDQLEGLERVLVPLGDWINESPTAKSMIQVYMRHVPGAFVESVLSHRWQPDGLEKLQNLHAERGAILVSNHRSFFDMFATGALFYRRLGLFERLYFPVRAPFWYTNALGALINLGLAGYSMWPPVFRDDRRRHVLNPIGIDQLLNALREPNACVGIHPEGARNKSADPWALMPARPGVGQLVRRAHPDTVVIPFFISGLSNDFVREVRGRIAPSATPLPPIRWTFGEALRAGDLAGMGSPLEIAHHLLHDVIAGLRDIQRSGGDPAARTAARTAAAGT